MQMTMTQNKNSSDTLDKNKEKKEKDSTVPHDLSDLVEHQDPTLKEKIVQEEPTGQDSEAVSPEEKKYHDAWLRACADLENMRRRKEKEMEEYTQYGHMVFAKELLSVADNLDRALLSVSSHTIDGSPLKAFYDGVCLTQKSLEKVFSTFGIKKIPALHSLFNPLYHDAVGEKPPSEKDTPDGTIVEVLQDGYLLKERVLRPAMVIVAKNHLNT